MPLPDPERTRRQIGLALYLIAFAVSLVLLVVNFLLPPLFLPNPLQGYSAMFLGAVLALPAGVMYLTVPRLLDRYDPEPWYALAGCLMWGAVVACGVSATINSVAMGIGSAVAGPEGGEVLGAVVSAPIVEEFCKGLAVWGVFFFLRREFDGVVDGVIYATFTALGFATVENVIYYAEAAQQGGDVLAMTLVLRGVLSPWVHPVFTAMIGIGFGMARESTSPGVRLVAPVIGYVAAVFLHFVWNGSATVGGGILFVVLLPLWLLFVVGFLIMIVVLVRRRGRIIRENLRDEVVLGNIRQEELELVCSAFGILKARMEWGADGAELIRAMARLGLSKWHTARAMEGQHQTVSMEFIVPLRSRIRELRAGLSSTD